MESARTTTIGPGASASPPVSFVPGTGRDPLVERRAAEAVAAALWRAVQSFSQDAVTTESQQAFEELAGTLLPYLESEQFLWLRVGERGFTVQRSRLTEASRPLAARLAQSGIVEIHFKRGVTSYELERCVAAMHETAAGGAHSAATRLWEAGLRHIVYRCEDEVLAAGDVRRDLLTWGATWPEGTAAIEHDELVQRFERFADPVEPAADWGARVALDARERGMLHGMRLDEPETVTERLAWHLASLQDQAAAAVRGGESLVLLGDVVEMLVTQHKFGLLHDVLAALQSGRDGTTASEATLEHVVDRLCTERHVVTLGSVLEDPQARPEDLAAVRAVLAGLPGAVDTLCRLLVRLEGQESRRHVCRVLAFVAREDPAALAQRVTGQPWYLARNVAYVLGRIGGGRVLPLLRKWMHHDDERVRIEVGRALARSREPGSIGMLAEMLDDESWRVRRGAVWSLAERGDASALPRLHAILFEDRDFRSRRAEERDDFFRTYGRLADAQAYAELERIVEQRQLVAVGWHAELRRGAVLALGESGRAEAARLLRGLERARDQRLRVAVAEAMEALRGRRASLGRVVEGPGAAAAARIPTPLGREIGFPLEFAEEK